jgi:uncharacterized protein YqeY
MMISIKEQVNSDLKDAMRARDQKTLSALRLITAAVKQIEVDERIEIDDTHMLAILNKMVKQRNESIAQFSAANRSDLVEQEQFELNLISRYLPEPLSDAEITEAINQAILAVGAKKMSDMGRVMTELKPKLQGRADMSNVSAMIKSLLN